MSPYLTGADVEGGFQLQLLFDNGDQNVGGDGTPNLRLHRVLAGAQKLLDHGKTKNWNPSIGRISTQSNGADFSGVLVGVGYVAGHLDRAAQAFEFLHGQKIVGEVRMVHGEDEDACAICLRPEVNRANDNRLFVLRVCGDGLDTAWDPCKNLRRCYGRQGQQQCQWAHGKGSRGFHEVPRWIKLLVPSNKCVRASSISL